MTDQSGTDSIATRLRARQAELDLNQSEAAKLIGVNPSVYGRWINLRQPMLPSPDNLPGVAAFLETTQSSLIGLFPASARRRALTQAAEIAELRQQLVDLRQQREIDLRGFTKIVDELTDRVQRAETRGSGGSAKTTKSPDRSNGRGSRIST